MLRQAELRRQAIGRMLVVAGYEEQMPKLGRVLGTSLGLQRSSQQQQQLVVL